MMSLLASHRNSRVAPRHGLTLMELVVVMAILIALSAILVPLLPNMLGRAHKSSETTNNTELTKAIQMYASVNLGSYPDGFDLLGDGASTNLAAYLPGNPLGAAAGDTTKALGGSLVPAPLDTAHLAALNSAGITQGWAMTLPSQTTGTVVQGTEPWTPTFNPYSSATALPLSTSTVVPYVKPAAILRASITSDLNVNLSSTTQFVLLGVGKRNAMIGKTIANAPNLFPNTPAEDPATFYERFGVIFQLEDVTGNALSVARFVGVVSIEADGMEGADKDLESYYQENKNN